MKLKTITPKVYKLYNSYQHYDWGTKNKNAFIPMFIGDEVKKNLPYAELWIGAHPRLSSEIKIDGELVSLEKIIEEFPNEVLGKNVAKKFKNKLPFLLKLLSANRALSIQTHPDKKTAEALHKKDPKNYADNNHKPEIAIAIDRLNAIVGFKSYKEILKVLSRHKEFAKAVNYTKVSKVLSVEEQKQFVKNLYTDIMNFSNETLEFVIKSILRKIKKLNRRTKEEKEFLLQYKNFGIDVGLISILLFNYIELKPEEAIFTGAGTPHAYLKGNIIECMANSDNVVRAGLTEKFKDVETLLSILNYDSSNNKKMIPPSAKTKFTYHAPISEFKISKNSFEKSKKQTKKNAGIKIILVTYGNLIVEWKEDSVVLSREFEQGEAILIPAHLESYKLTNKIPTKFVMVEVP
ncbi:MAG: mannose-6-phosphate isomerase, class I [Melioribacteraceae bacterium]